MAEALPPAEDAEVRQVHYGWYVQDDFDYHGELWTTRNSAERDLLARLWNRQLLFEGEISRLPGYNPQDEFRYVEAGGEGEDDEVDEVDDTAAAFLRDNIKDYVERREHCFQANRSWRRNLKHYIDTFREDILELLNAHELSYLIERFAMEDMNWGIVSKVLPAGP